MSEMKAHGPARHPGPTAEHTLDVLSYNVFLRAPTCLFFRDRHRERVHRLPEHLRDYDVLVLQEVFSKVHRGQLLAALATTHRWTTCVLGGGRWGKINGGVIIASRHRIEEEQQVAFGQACAGIDSLADKGVLYARIVKHELRYHVFGTHAQVGAQHRAVRWQQLRMTKEFIESLQIPPTEPVILAGDLNVDLRTDANDGEYGAMKRLLDVTHPDPPPGSERVPTQDGLHNELVRYDFRKHLDYVLYSNAHLRPLSAFNRVYVAQSEGRDLSDHYAVHGRFVFPVAGA